MPRRRGRKPPPDLGSLYPTLDLHGETADSARRRASEWLRRQRDGGERVVRLITGRGKHSVGPAVLREEIAHLLQELRGELVGRVEEEAGGGALRVELRPPREVSPVRPRRDREGAGATPELRRQAEEALHELGIQPTAELLEIEIRRLRAGEKNGA